MAAVPQRYAHLQSAPLPRWLAAALGELGQREIAGAASNPRIIAYRKEGGTPMGGDDGAVPWCAIFVNAMLRRVNLEGSGSAMARSFLSSGKFIKLPRPALGAIAVKSSASRGAAAGHVGFYVGEGAQLTHLLGGNQDDEVNFAPFRSREFLGFMWPEGELLPAPPWNKGFQIASRGAFAPVRDV